MATFGRRTHFPGAPLEHSKARTPWLAWFMGALLACTIGAGAFVVLPMLTAPGGPAPVVTEAVREPTLSPTEFAPQFTALAARQPEEAQRLMTAAIEMCLPEGGSSYGTGAVKVLAAELLTRSLALQSDNSATAEQTDRLFRVWIESAITRLPADQLDHFKGLMAHLRAEGVPLCLLSTIHRSY